VVSDVSEASDPVRDGGAGRDGNAGGAAGAGGVGGDGILRPRVVLMGPPGSGKTTVGHALAGLLGVELHDTDEAIQAEQGRSISDIFMDDGEPRFRELERAEVASSLSSRRGVLSLGGGAVMDPMTQAALAGHTVVFLDVGIADAARRVGFNHSRPLLAVNPRAQWSAMMDLRRPTYERLATLTVLTSGRTPQDIAAEIVQRLDQMKPEQARPEQARPEPARPEPARPEPDSTGDRRE
jgi:shikimate kinase